MRPLCHGRGGDPPAPIISSHCRVASRFACAKPQAKERQMRQDLYRRITDQIVGELEKGVRPWLTPWHVEHAAGRITRPLRFNRVPYRGINIVMLWGAAIAGATPRPSG